MRVSEYERRLLQHLNGEDVPDLMWGAAMSAAIEFLREDGYISGHSTIRITDKGRRALEPGQSVGKAAAATTLQESGHKETQ